MISTFHLPGKGGRDGATSISATMQVMDPVFSKCLEDALERASMPCIARESDPRGRNVVVCVPAPAAPADPVPRSGGLRAPPAPDGKGGPHPPPSSGRGPDQDLEHGCDARLATRISRRRAPPAIPRCLLPQLFATRTTTRCRARTPRASSPAFWATRRPASSRSASLPRVASSYPTPLLPICPRLLDLFPLPTLTRPAPLHNTLAHPAPLPRSRWVPA